MYQGFSSDLMMLMGNLMQWKFRMPAIFKKALRSMTEKTVHDVCTKTVWKADDVHKTAAAVRQYKERLGFSEQWMSEYVYNIVLLAKKSRNIRTKKRKQNEKRNVIKQKRIVKNSTNSKAEVFYLRFFCYIYANISILTI